ncbi:MAG: hypothetical protein ACW99F_14925, partial [Candidatus Hodarchaeales archaeon]
MREKFVLLEFSGEIEFFLKYCRTKALSPADFRIIALQPEVQVSLKKRGISYENTLDYFSNESHKNALLKSEEWYRFFEKKLNLEDPELKETYTNTLLFYLRYYFNHFLIYLEVLSNICNNLDVESIHTCFYVNEFCFNELPIIQENERFLGIIAEKFGENQGIDWEKIPSNHKFKKKEYPKLFIDFKINLEKIISFFYKFFISNFNKDKTILLTSTGYNVESLSEKLNSYFPKIHWITVSRETAIQS